MTDLQIAITQYDGNNKMPYADLVVDALKEKENREKAQEHCYCCSYACDNCIYSTHESGCCPHRFICNNRSHYKPSKKYCDECGRNL